jgi:hypothetical protein
VSPRAREEIVHPRLQSGASGRPLNFTVRRPLVAAHLKAVVNIGVLALGWVVTLVGCIVVAGALTGLYMLLVMGASPGQPVFLDAVVPPLRGAVLHLANGIALISVPFIVRWVIRQWRQSRSSGSSET